MYYLLENNVDWLIPTQPIIKFRLDDLIVSAEKDISRHILTKQKWQRLFFPTAFWLGVSANI